jgi:hypothetical protein
MPMSRDKPKPLRADPKPTASSHRYLFVVEVTRNGEKPLPSNSDTSELIQAGIEASGLCEPSRDWYVSHMEPV